MTGCVPNVKNCLASTHEIINNCDLRRVRIVSLEEKKWTSLMDRRAFIMISIWGYVDERIFKSYKYLKWCKNVRLRSCVCVSFKYHTHVSPEKHVEEPLWFLAKIRRTLLSEDRSIGFKAKTTFNSIMQYRYYTCQWKAPWRYRVPVD